MNLNNTYDYGYTSTMNAAASVLSGILTIYLIVMAVAFLFYVISYIFAGIGMYRIAKRRYMDYPWLAFIPFARTYLHGELAGRIALKKNEIKNPGIWFLVLPFIVGAVNVVFYMIMSVISVTSVPFGDYGSRQSATGAIMGLLILLVLWILVSLIFGAVTKVLRILINNQIIGNFTSRNMAVVHAVLSTLIPLYESVCLFVMSSRDFNPGMEPQMPQPLPPVQDMYQPVQPAQEPAEGVSQPVQSVEEPAEEMPQPVEPVEEPAEEMPQPEPPVQEDDTKDKEKDL